MLYPDRTMWHCPVKGCKFAVLTQGGVASEHKCPYPLGESRYSWMSYGPSLLQTLWDEMDRITEELMNPPVTYENGEAVAPSGVSVMSRGRARGIAYALSLFMVPHFTTEDEVVREAVKRYKAKQAGEDYETPGLGSRNYEPPPTDNKYSTKMNMTRTASVPVEITVDPKLVETVKLQASAGFPDDLIAKANGITVTQVREYIKM